MVLGLRKKPSSVTTHSSGKQTVRSYSRLCPVNPEVSAAKRWFVSKLSNYA